LQVFANDKRMDWRDLLVEIMRLYVVKMLMH